jgi:hypothetical protein
MKFEKDKRKVASFNDDKIGQNNGNGQNNNGNCQNNNGNGQNNNGNNDHNNPNGFVRDAADRTLLRIKNKLLGFENPTSGGLGVEGQVELIISEARSIDNLCRLFPGWAPWI